MVDLTVTMNDSHKIQKLGFGVFQVPLDDTQRVVEDAFEVGYRHIDTAAGYRNEPGVGRAFRASGLKRDEVFITTKLYNDSHGYQETLDAFEASSAALELDYVDLYLIHWPRPTADRFVESWHAFETLRDEGRIRSIGVSNFRVQDLEKLAANSTTIPAVNQIELHPHFQQEELREYHRTHNILTESWSPIGQGTVLGEPLLAEIGQRYGKSAAQVVIRWHIDLGIIVIPKSIHRNRMVENFDVFDFSLTTDEISSIRTLETGQRTGFNPSEFEGLWN
jgi:2,5-diketo-D-gluconate reductase A